MLNREVVAKTYGLTPRELDALSGVTEGRADKLIARDLNLSSRTVEIHVSRVRQKLGVESRIQAVIKGFREGWLQ